MNDFVIYLVVRKDLKMTTGKIAAQCGHAVEHIVLQTPKSVMNLYHNNSSPKITLQVKSLEELESIHNSCRQANIQTFLVKDAGHTQVIPGTITVLGIGPVRKKFLPDIVAQLKLL